VWKKNVATTKDRQLEFGGVGNLVDTIVQWFCGKFNAYVL